MGALTLGVNLQKDPLTQAAMRLRQLGTTQSVTFFAPPEVHQSIVELGKVKDNERVDSSHVVLWLLVSTCQALESSFPLFYSMGIDYCERTQAALDYPNFLYDPGQLDQLLKVIRQKEKRTLKQLYEPKLGSVLKKSDVGMKFDSQMGAFVKDLIRGRKAFQDSNNAVHASALQEVEQEREVEIEVALELIRQLQRPPRFHPLRFEGLHKDILRLVSTGKLLASSDGYEQAFEALRRTAVGKKYGISKQATTSPIYSSMEFLKTVMVPLGKPCDAYMVSLVFRLLKPQLTNTQRPVQFLLYIPASETALLVSPEEAEILIRRCREQEGEPKVHLVNYSAAVTKKMLHFDNLTYHSTPPMPSGFRAPTWLKVQLGLLAGRLYFAWSEYKELRSFLGLANEDAFDELDMAPVPNDTSSEEEVVGRVEESVSTTLGNSNSNGIEGLGANEDVASGKDDVEATEHLKCSKEEPKTYRFTAKPRAFLADFLSARRKNEDWKQSSPLGWIVQAKPLKRNHPFFARHDGSVAQKMALAGGGEVVEEDDDDDDEDFVYGDLGVEDGDPGVFDAEAYDFVEEEGDESSGTEESEEEDCLVL